MRMNTRDLPALLLNASWLQIGSLVRGAEAAVTALQLHCVFVKVWFPCITKLLE